MRMGQFTERGRFVFEAGKTANDPPSPRLASSVIERPSPRPLDDLDRLLISSGVAIDPPFPMRPVAALVRALVLS